MSIQEYDVVIIGAGAAGLMCASTAGYRGRQVLVLDHAKQAGKKILISGGGRCNFTNHNIEPSAYLCPNPHFVKSALARYNQWHFIELVERHGVEFHEKTLGQLFCNDSAKEIVRVLKTECEWAGVTIQLNTEIIAVTHNEQGYLIRSSQGDYQCQSLVIATGGLSMPKLGATPFGFKIAAQFDIAVTPTRAGLVPFTWLESDKQAYESLSGIALPIIATSANGKSFKEAMLFTHRGLSGPAILQISNYWQQGQSISLNLLPELDFATWFNSKLQESAKQSLKTALSHVLPKRLVERLIELEQLVDKPLNQFVPKDIQAMAQRLQAWQVTPNGTEGYRTAEITLGGVDVNAISSKTMMANKQQGLYFIGEVLDVGGHLGGYNFQWAWSSGYAAGEVV